MGKRVLFINNARSLLLISGFLARTGYDVDTAPGVGPGLAKLETRSYDIVVVIESAGAPSWATCEEIRRLTGVPLIILCPNATAEACVRAINAGADYFMRKPFGPLELLARIRSLLQRAPLRQPAMTSPS